MIFSIKIVILNLYYQQQTRLPLSIFKQLCRFHKDSVIPIFVFQQFSACSCALNAWRITESSNFFHQENPQIY